MVWKNRRFDALGLHGVCSIQNIWFNCFNLITSLSGTALGLKRDKVGEQLKHSNLVFHFKGIKIS